MIRTIGSTRTAAIALLTAMALALSGCLLAPGKFVSALDIRKDGTFTFTYVGEIHLLAMSRLAGQDAARSAPFTPEPCYSGSGADRPCTPAELSNQKAAWEEERRMAAERDGRNAESMKAMHGGLDPADPRAAEEFASRLRRQVGWRRVTYKGDGLYDVDFALTGRLDHDFSFPTIERFPMTNPFVQLALRQDGTLRIDAPAFGPAQGGDPFRTMMQAGAMSGGGQMESAAPEVSEPTSNPARNGGLVEVGKPSSGMTSAAKPARSSPSASTAAMPPMPVMDGRFTIRTDGAILANNTDEGPMPDPAGQRLDWTVNLHSPAAPTALVRLTR